MAEFSRTKDGIVRHAKYTTHGVSTLKSIYPEDPANAKKYLHKKKGAPTEIHHYYGARTNSMLLRKIYIT